MIVTIDALDHYLRVLSRIDGLVPDTLHDKLNGRKVPADDHRPTFYERLDALHAAFPGARAEHLLAMNLLANWRNRFAHGDYKFALTDKECEVIAQTAAFFRDNHGGADIQAALDRYTRSQAPTLLDLSTLIASAQRSRAGPGRYHPASTGGGGLCGGARAVSSGERQQSVGAIGMVIRTRR
jgi:hypothetical protein